MESEESGEVGFGKGGEAYKVEVLEFLLDLLNLVLEGVSLSRWFLLLYLIGKILKHQVFPHNLFSLCIPKPPCSISYKSYYIN